MAVLEQLACFYAGQRVVLIWDGLWSHWSTKMRAFLDRQRDWLRAERLPAYAPELNPVEGLWANLKDLELANRPTSTLAEVADATEHGIQRVGKHQDLVVGFLAHTGLTLDP
jgi:transposase